MKKIGVFLLFCLVFSFAIVSAYSYGSAAVDLRQGSEQVIQWAVDFGEPFLQVLLGGEDYTGLLLFEKLLIFILLLSIIFISLKNIPVLEDQKVVLWVVSIIVPLIGVRYIDYGWLNSILLTYKVLAISIAGILPLLIFMFFIHNVIDSFAIRRVSWLFFILIYIGLWSTAESSYEEIYFWTLVAAIAFLIFDTQIHRFFESQKFKDAERSGIYRRLAEIDKDISTMEKSTSLPQHKKIHELLKLRKERENTWKKL